MPNSGSGRTKSFHFFTHFKMNLGFGDEALKVEFFNVIGGIVQGVDMFHDGLDGLMHAGGRPEDFFLLDTAWRLYSAVHPPQTGSDLDVLILRPIKMSDLCACRRHRSWRTINRHFLTNQF